MNQAHFNLTVGIVGLVPSSFQRADLQAIPAACWALGREKYIVFCSLLSRGKFSAL
jgi:hypothetical protein